MIRAVVDTNVIVSALISPFGNEAMILEEIRRGEITPCFSPPICAEYREVLARPKFGFSPGQIAGLMECLQERGLLCEPPPLTVDLPDPADLPFLFCALHSGAGWIVTGNKRHFPAECCTPVQVLSAREAMAELRRLRHQ